MAKEIEFLEAESYTYNNISLATEMNLLVKKVNFMKQGTVGTGKLSKSSEFYIVFQM